MGSVGGKAVEYAHSALVAPGEGILNSKTLLDENGASHCAGSFATLSHGGGILQHTAASRLSFAHNQHWYLVDGK